MKIDWKRNLMISWIGCFFTGASFSLVMPFIPLYIEQLGTPKNQVELFSGLAISVTAFASAVVAPIWGNLADRKGRRLIMIRAAAGMTFSMGALAFVPNVYWLLGMRFMTGILSGYIPNATALIASQAPKEKSGWALGTLATGGIAGSLIGPSMGGRFSSMVRDAKRLYHHRCSFVYYDDLDRFFCKREFRSSRKTRDADSQRDLQTCRRCASISRTIYYIIDFTNRRDKYHTYFNFIHTSIER